MTSLYVNDRHNQTHTLSITLWDYTEEDGWACWKVEDGDDIRFVEGFGMLNSEVWDIVNAAAHAYDDELGS